MSVALPDDRLLWEIYTGVIDYPTLLAAIQLKVFDVLAGKECDLSEIQHACAIGPRAAKALMSHLVAMKLLTKKARRFRLTVLSRVYLDSSGPSYWGRALLVPQKAFPLFERLMSAIKAERARKENDDAHTALWKKGEVDPVLAAEFTRTMNVFSLAAARGASRHPEFRRISNLLDVGAGSGSFSIAIAKRWPKLRCTLFDFDQVCDVAMSFVNEAKLAHRIVAQSGDMFQSVWPSGHDGVFFANVLHDWSLEQGAVLLRKAFDALPSGGRVFVNEMLLNATETGPRAATGMTIAMLVQTEGQQFTASQLKRMLKDAGFEDVRVFSTTMLYSMVCATKR